ncbi:Scr1 family TA system antitoxin-like transcriptional regulator [Streptomyces sp. NPDC005227]|uniref:helix-turn-helix domain-containing protein n=1 Tax=Streptomyces sp. NPDC005227 TaxID=3364707 RepID=UPI0036840FAB
MSPRRHYKKNASAMKMLGAMLATLRRAAGHSQASLSRHVGAQEETIASIEQGRRPLKDSLAAELDEFLDTKGVLAVAVENMPEIDLVPRWVDEYLDLEKTAPALSFYANAVLPGSLQTENYARAVFRSRVPAYSEDEVERRTAARTARQGLLRRPTPTTVSFVIWEAVLMDRIGGPEVFAEQLRHLRADSDLAGVSLQILPFGRSAHAGLAGPFILLETDDHQRLAYAETQRGSQLVADPGEVSALSQKYAMLRTQALNTEDSKGLLDRMLGGQ